MISGGGVDDQRLGRAGPSPTRTRPPGKWGQLDGTEIRFNYNAMAVLIDCDPVFQRRNRLSLLRDHLHVLFGQRLLRGSGSSCLGQRSGHFPLQAFLRVVSGVHPLVNVESLDNIFLLPLCGVLRRLEPILASAYLLLPFRPYGDVLTHSRPPFVGALDVVLFRYNERSNFRSSSFFVFASGNTVFGYPVWVSISISLKCLLLGTI